MPEKVEVFVKVPIRFDGDICSSECWFLSYEIQGSYCALFNDHIDVDERRCDECLAYDEGEVLERVFQSRLK